MRPETISGTGPSFKRSFLNTVFRVQTELHASASELLYALAPPVSHDKPDIAVAESIPTLGSPLGDTQSCSDSDHTLNKSTSRTFRHLRSTFRHFILCRPPVPMPTRADDDERGGHKETTALEAKVASLQAAVSSLQDQVTTLQNQLAARNFTMALFVTGPNPRDVKGRVSFILLAIRPRETR